MNCQEDHLGLALGLGQAQVQDHHQDEVSLVKRQNEAEHENQKQQKLLWNESRLWWQEQGIRSVSSNILLGTDTVENVECGRSRKVFGKDYGFSLCAVPFAIP